MDDPKRSGPAGPHRPPRLWTVGEANGRLDPLREQLPELRAWAMRLGKVHEEIERLRAFWGREVDAVDNPDRELRERLEAEWKRLGARLEHEVLELRSDGIEIKDLGSGLVDFYARIDGEIVFLCWQRDEDFVNHWHRLSGGYRTRQRLEGAAGADHHRVPHGI